MTKKIDYFTIAGSVILFIGIILDSIYHLGYLFLPMYVLDILGPVYVMLIISGFSIIVGSNW